MKKKEFTRAEISTLSKLYEYEFPEYSAPYPPQYKGTTIKHLIDKGLAKEIIFKEGIMIIICHELTDLGIKIYKSMIEKIKE